MAWDHNGLAKEFASRLPSSNPCLTTKTQCVFSCFYIFKLILPYCLIHQFFFFFILLILPILIAITQALTHIHTIVCFVEVFHGVKRNKTQKENAFLLIDIQLLLGNKHVTSCQNLLSNRIPPLKNGGERTLGSGVKGTLLTQLLSLSIRMQCLSVLYTV